jgi:hypothetical protein
MFDKYEFITGDQLENLREQGWIISPVDGALLPPGTIEQLPELECVSMTDLIDTWQLWTDGYTAVQGSEKG